VNKELIIQSSGTGVEIALLEDKKLVELHYDNSGGNYNVGDLYLGKARKVVQGLNAVFVDIGAEKDAFLHYTDLSPHFKSLLKFTHKSMNDTNGELKFENFTLEPEIHKSGKIKEVVQTKKNVLVQILKEPIANKGPRISCEISLPGRYLVLLPFHDMVNVSKKVEGRDERKRLKTIITSIKPKGFGVIVRTAATDKTTSQLHQDLSGLVESWKNIQFNLKNSKAPQKILAEQNKTTSLLRDLLTDDFNNIVTNNNEVLEDTKKYIKKIAPEREGLVSFHSNGKPLFDSYGISKQMKSSFGKTVMLDKGGYLIIEHTEALHVVDVNSGHKFSGENQEATAVATNLDAVKEIARQLRLRDIGGIIIIDFIDMRNADNRKKVTSAMHEAMKNDRARHSLLSISRFGLMQITRQRLRPAIEIATSEVCPSCEGTGKARSTHVLTEDLEKHIRYLTSQIKNGLELHLHPIVSSHLQFKTGFFKKSIFQNWKKKYGKFTIVENNDMGFIDYKFFDAETQEQIKF